MAFELENVVPWGRSLREYVAMFALTAPDLQKKLLGCADGPASFNYELQRDGGKICSVDPLYQYSGAQISQRIAATYPMVLQQLEQNQADYWWRDIPSVQALGKLRLAAMRLFLQDYPLGKTEGRYITGELPQLPFVTQQFELALCSHFLFLYSTQLSLDFHRQAITELLRVASEVRIFPLLDLAGQPSPHVTPLIIMLEKQHYRAEIVTVAYEFQRGGNQMLRITTD
jgi:hypothetical protein